MTMVTIWFAVLVALGLVISLILSLRFNDWIADLRSAAPLNRLASKSALPNHRKSCAGLPSGMAAGRMDRPL